tara:strand:- start:164 stop:277 length:114 start_codon:yes stop_codon:yes gene_type:complete
MTMDYNISKKVQPELNSGENFTFQFAPEKEPNEKKLE